MGLDLNVLNVKPRVVNRFANIVYSLSNKWFPCVCSQKLDPYLTLIHSKISVQKRNVSVEGLTYLTL
jgi:hypothetical protein